MKREILKLLEANADTTAAAIAEKDPEWLRVKSHLKSKDDRGRYYLRKQRDYQLGESR